MSRPLVRKGKKVSLGIHEREEIPYMYSEFADFEVQRFLGRPDRLYNLDSEYEWFESLSKTEDSRVLAILLNLKGASAQKMSPQSLIGNIGIHGIDPVSRKAELGYLLFRKFWGKGYGTEAVGLAVDYAFETLNLRKLTARVFEPNPASSAVLLKNGFRLAGKLKEHQYINSIGYVDELYYELHRKA